MFEIVEIMLSQLAEIIPWLLLLFILFDFIGMLLFGKR